MPRLTRILCGILGCDSIVLTPDTTADDVPGWDSMNHIFIVVEIERRFDIKFRTAEMEELRNAGELVHLIGTKLSAPSA